MRYDVAFTETPALKSEAPRRQVEAPVQAASRCDSAYAVTALLRLPWQIYRPMAKRPQARKCAVPRLRVVMPCRRACAPEAALFPPLLEEAAARHLYTRAQLCLWRARDYWHLARCLRAPDIMLV